MRVRMKTTMAGPAGVWLAGSDVDLPPAAAYALIEGRFADQVDQPGTEEQAMLSAPETTARRRRRPSPGK
ncbi:hypothetical protein FRZ44_38090 [Hypericibacter terrae]|uniref:Uncharacterized protein n=1 Tax=Hypericibacter terrae TaxID=2602015 RepID=A0A5J6MLM5_9PROT|nr:hypothetical protein [Hypericibacter terrae]QEX18502.1 hypothetical protein FRZ44_38090 [Hypericibacter terrae]